MVERMYAEFARATGNRVGEGANLRHETPHANCGNRDKALPRSMALRCACGIVRPSWVFTASAMTRAFANGQSLPNTIWPGAATPARHCIVSAAGDSALSYQTRRSRA